MSNKAIILFLCSFVLLQACKAPVSIVWTEGPTDHDSGRAAHQMHIVSPPSGTDWTIWFCQFRTPVRMEEGAPASISHLEGTLYRVIPTTDTHGQDMVLNYEAKPLVNHCRAPEGFYLQRGKRRPVPVKVEYVWQPWEDVKSFTHNPVETSVFDMVPSLKQVAQAEGTTPVSALSNPETVTVEGQVHGWYRITLDGSVRVESSDPDGAWYASVTLDNLRRNAAGDDLPNAVITDWPDLPYRGIMLDVSRNFTKKEGILTLIDIMAHYKATHLHLHLGDDEGWRVEIDGLPELTSYGAFRSIPVLREDGGIDEPDALQPTYCVTLDRKQDSPGNGFFSRSDFIEILRYAGERHIRIIPEFDTPGHSRAAIKSMDYRARTTGDSTYLLSEPADTSRYVSVQDYTDNALNVALPSTYAFIGKVFDGIIALYAEAGVPLEAIHVGGDEVPEGAWTGSPSCRELLASLGRDDVSTLKDYFIGRVLQLAAERGIKIAGWQEVAQHLEPETFELLKDNLAYVNHWAVSRGRIEIAYEYANEGVDVVLSSAPNLYFDFAYNRGKAERGHSWGGFVDERRSFSLLPYDLYRSVRWDDKGRIKDISHASDGKPALLPEGRPHIKGVQGQLWAETLRSFDHVTYYLFPKSLGMFERGWNAEPVWADTTVSDDPLFTADFDRFFSIVTDHEYPYYDSLGISYHRN